MAGDIIMAAPERASPIRECEAAMVRVLAVISKERSEVLEFLALEDRRYPSADAFLEAARNATRDLWMRYGLPNDELELFDGSDRSVESFFRMFPNLKLTPRSKRSVP